MSEHSMMWQDGGMVGVDCKVSGRDYVLDHEDGPRACPCGDTVTLHWDVRLEVTSPATPPDSPHPEPCIAMSENDADDWTFAWEHPPARWTAASGEMCDRCGKRPAVTIGPDPFVAEVYNEVGEDEAWCEECWDERKDEV